MLDFLKRFVIGLGKSLLAIVLVFAIYLGYGLFAERAAQERSRAICASIAPGQDSAPLRDRALADGASDTWTRWRNADGVDTLFITYVGLPPFSRHLCIVQAKDGKVVSAQLSSLD